jgi:hypothetical protein
VDAATGQVLSVPDTKYSPGTTGQVVSLVSKSQLVDRLSTASGKALFSAFIAVAAKQ